MFRSKEACRSIWQSNHQLLEADGWGALETPFMLDGAGVTLGIQPGHLLGILSSYRAAGSAV